MFIKNFNQKSAQACNGGRDHSKNAASLKSHTSKGYLIRWCRAVFVFGLIALFCTSCKTSQVPSDSLTFLVGQRELDVVISYEDVLLQGKPEKTYLSGEQPGWVENWEKAKETVFKESFLGHLNSKVRIRCGDYPDAQYQATVFILSVDRKFMYGGSHLEGPGTREVTCEVVFTKMGDSFPLATISAKGDSGGGGKVFDPSGKNTIGGILGAAGGNTQLTGKAFGYLGQNLGNIIVRKMK